MSRFATTTTGTERTWRTTASRAVHPSVERGAGPLVETIAAGLAAVSGPWELTGPRELTNPDPGERSYQLLLSTEQYDAWLIHWPARTGLAPHDHGGSCGAFAVVSGTLDEERIRPDGTRSRRRVGPAASVSFGAHEIHAVANRGEEDATSVHVYSPPLGSMRFYRADDDGRLVAVDVPR